jgi:hypothetical protein
MHATLVLPPRLPLGPLLPKHEHFCMDIHFTSYCLVKSYMDLGTGNMVECHPVGQVLADQLIAHANKHPIEAQEHGLLEHSIR